MLRYALLGFLNYHSLNGYDLKNVMEDSARNFWHADLSQIYKNLKTLQEQGMITSTLEMKEDRPDRRVYTITEAGRREFAEWLATPLTEITPIKEVLLLKIFFSAQAERISVLTQLRLQRELHRRNLQRYAEQTVSDIEKNIQRLGASLDDALFWDATRRAGVLYEEMYIQWLDETIARLETLSEGGT
ncbi:MAG: PadR family transcriptional regulator [Anaerolineae bacterium]|nr:PadR family transcriptional regulator [Anaerolineae bacterium]